MEEKKRKKKVRHPQPVNDKNPLAATLMNLVITIVELAGGILSNSIALLSDALHNLTDAFASFIAYVATRMSKRKPGTTGTSGYDRVQILAAMFNALIVIVTCSYLFKEAWERLQNPEPIKSLIIMIVAMIGLGANVLAVTLLKGDAKKNKSVKAARVHLIGNSFSSVVVVLAAAAIQLFEIYWLDSLVTFLIGIYLILKSFMMLKESVNILMQSTPEHMDLKKIRNKIESIPEISNIHHLHVWSLSENEIHLEAHVEVSEDLRIREAEVIREKVEHLLKKHYLIHHITLQFEYKTAQGNRLVPGGQ